MLIEELVSYYQKTAGVAVSEVPKGSILGGTADEILEMVTCYASDAAVFLKHEDLVNAFAASEYGLGWLDCGIYLGYTKAVFTNCLELAKEFPEELFEKLEEKRRPCGISGCSPEHSMVLYLLLMQRQDVMQQ